MLQRFAAEGEQRTAEGCEGGDQLAPVGYLAPVVAGPACQPGRRSAQQGTPASRAARTAFRLIRAA